MQSSIFLAIKEPLPPLLQQLLLPLRDLLLLWDAASAASLHTVVPLAHFPPRYPDASLRHGEGVRGGKGENRNREMHDVYQSRLCSPFEQNDCSFVRRSALCFQTTVASFMSLI